MEVHAHTHTARKKCPPDRTGWDPLFPGVFNVISCPAPGKEPTNIMLSGTMALLELLKNENGK